MTILRYIQKETERLHRMLCNSHPCDANNLNLIVRYHRLLKAFNSSKLCVAGLQHQKIYSLTQSGDYPKLTTELAELVIDNYANQDTAPIVPGSPFEVPAAYVDLDYLLEYVDYLGYVDDYHLNYVKHEILLLDGTRTTSSTVLTLVVFGEHISLDSTTPKAQVLGWLKTKGRLTGYIGKYIKTNLAIQESETLPKPVTDRQKLDWIERSLGLMRFQSRLSELTASCENSELFKAIDSGVAPNVSKAFVEALIDAYAEMDNRMDELFDLKYDWVAKTFPAMAKAKSVKAVVAYVPDPHHFRFEVVGEDGFRSNATADLPKELIPGALEKFSV